MDLKDILNEKNCLPAKVISLDKVPIAKKNGFLSDITSITLHLTNGEEIHLISKMPLKACEEGEMKMFSEFSQAANVFELNFYQKIYSELKQMITELHLPSPLPECYYAGNTEDGLVIVLDDLTRRGLQMPSFETDIPESDVRSILRSLAVVQAGACELQLRRQASLLELFPFLKKNDASIVGIEDLCKKNTDLCKKALIKEFPDKEILLDLFSAIAADTNLIEYFYSSNEADFFLSHGDVWNNNIFINDKERVFIDWQCISAGCPTGDIVLLVAFGTDLGPEPVKRFESYVRCYLDFLVECCGDNAALREMVEQRVVPLMSSAKMIKMSLQYIVKVFIACWDALIESDTKWFTFSNVGDAMKTRITRNMCNILLDLHQ